MNPEFGDCLGFVIPPFTTMGGAERVIAEEIKYAANNDCSVVVITEEVSQELVQEFEIPDTVEFRVVKSGHLPKRTLEIRRKARDVDVFMSHHNDRSVYLENPFDTSRKFAHVHGTVLWFFDHIGRFVHQNKAGVEALFEETPGHKKLTPQNPRARLAKLKAYCTEWLEAASLRSFNTVFVDSFQVKKELRAMYGVDSKVVRPGVSQEWLDAFPNITPIPLSDAEINLLSVSRLDERKRIDMAIKSFREIHRERDDVHLTICGDGPERTHLEGLSKDYGLEESITFTGYVSEKDLAGYYKAADIFLCPGWMSYGIVPIEAYGMGCKVVVSSDTFAHEVLREKPGVQVSQPTVRALTSSITSAISDGNTPTRNVPTWERYCSEKFGAMSKTLF